MLIEILMSRRNNQGGCGRNEPSAPPIHMMPRNPSSSDTNEPLYREPPPSYQEAILDDTSTNPNRILGTSGRLDDISRQRSGLSVATNDQRRLPSPTYQNNAPNSRGYNNGDQQNRGRPQQEEQRLQQRHPRQTGSLTGSIERLNNGGNDDSRNRSRSRGSGGGGGGASGGSRYRSASPSELSEGAQDGSEERCSTNESAKKKKSSGSKIKKGLENIAFFIIQILD